MNEELEILKTDVLGRVTLPPEKREALLDEFEKSGMPASQFCRHYGIGQQTFSTWVCNRRRARGEYIAKDTSNHKPKVKKAPKSLALVEAVVEAKTIVLKVELANGVKLEVNDRSQLPDSSLGSVHELFKIINDATM